MLQLFPISTNLYILRNYPKLFYFEGNIFFASSSKQRLKHVLNACRSVIESTVVLGKKLRTITKQTSWSFIEICLSVWKKKYVGYPDYRALRNKSHCSWDKIRFLSTGNPFDLKCGVCLIQYFDDLSILPTEVLVCRVLIIHGSKLNHYLQPLKYMQITEMCKCKWVFYFQIFIFKAIFKYWQILIDAWRKRKLIFF